MLFKELTYVIAIAKNKSISKAADKLYIAQPSLSQFLKQYEELLGVRLFDRKNTGIVPTEAGRIYIETAHNILRQYEEMIQSLPKDKEALLRRVTFAIADQRGALLLPHLMSTFGKEHPDIDLNVLELYPTTLHATIAEGRADAAMDITLFKKHRKIDGVDYSPMAVEEIYLAVHRDHPLLLNAMAKADGTRRWISLRVVCRENFVLLVEGRRLRILGDKLFRDIGVIPSVIQYTSNMSTAINLVEKGIAMTFAPHVFAIPNKNIEYLSIGRKGCFWGISILTNSNRMKSYEIIALSDTLRFVVQNMNKRELRAAKYPPSLGAF